jgi:hypothetical protein
MHRPHSSQAILTSVDVIGAVGHSYSTKVTLNVKFACVLCKLYHLIMFISVYKLQTYHTVHCISLYNTNLVHVEERDARIDHFYTQHF